MDNTNIGQEEKPRRFHGLVSLLASATHAETAASDQALRQAIASGSCVWGYREHHMVKNAPGADADRVCSRCGYGPKGAPSASLLAESVQVGTP